MEYKDFDLDFRLDHKVAVITGGANGIGAAIAHCLAQKGANVYLIDKSESVREVAAQMAATYGIKAYGKVEDLTRPGCAKELAEDCITQLGAVHILINNAGLSFLDKAEDLAEDKWDLTLQLNLKVPFLLSQSFAKKMILGGGGKIINIASQGGLIALDQHVAYCASKAGILSLTQVCALEWGKYNIHVNAISPTVVLTEMGLSYWVGQRATDMLKEIPIGRFGYPKEVGAACLFLASEASNLMSGSNLILDGGYTAK